MSASAPPIEKEKDECKFCDSPLLEKGILDLYKVGYRFCNSCGDFIINQGEKTAKLYEGMKDIDTASCDKCKMSLFIYVISTIETDGRVPIIHRICCNCSKKVISESCVNKLSEGGIKLSDELTIVSEGDELTLGMKGYSLFFRMIVDPIRMLANSVVVDPIRVVCDFFRCNPMIFKTFMGVLFLSWIWYLTSLFFVCTVIPIIIAHEYGHLIAMNMVNMKTSGMIMIPGIGLIAVAKEEIFPGKKEFYIAIAGPLVGYVAICMMIFSYLYIVPNETILAVAGLATIIHILNLLPVAPLDGGRMFRSACYLIGKWPGIILSILFWGASVSLCVYMEAWFITVLLVVFGYAELLVFRKKEKLPKRKIIMGLMFLCLYFMFFCVFFVLFATVNDSEIRYLMQVMVK